MLENEKLMERIYPEFPASEYQARHSKVTEVMASQGLDGLLLSAGENVEYFTGYICGYWKRTAVENVGVAIIPREGEPVLIIPDFQRGTAEGTAWVRSMRRHAHTHTRQRDFANLVVNTFKELGLEEGVIGYESGRLLSIGMPIADFDKVRQDLKDARFVSESDAVWAARAYKSPLEIERLERANEITFRGYEEARRKVKEGMTEVEVTKIFKSTFLEEGADGYRPNGLGFFNIRAGEERYPMSDTLPVDRKLQKGDMLVMNLGASYRGYQGHTARYAFVGQPSKRKRQTDALMKCIQQAIAEVLKPGLQGIDLKEYVFRAVREGNLDLSEFRSKDYGAIGGGLDKMSFEEAVLASMTEDLQSQLKPDGTLPAGATTGGCPVGGINLGLNVHEHPRIAVGMEARTEAGMCITMTCWLHDHQPGGMGIFSWEHPFVVTETGNRPLVEVHLKEETWVI